jgi:hypothetical protein
MSPDGLSTGRQYGAPLTSRANLSSKKTFDFLIVVLVARVYLPSRKCTAGQCLLWPVWQPLFLVHRPLFAISKRMTGSSLAAVLIRKQKQLDKEVDLIYIVSTPDR